MNCQEFERTIVDLGYDHLMGASTHARALAHAETCAQCASRLNREQRMAAGLRALAAKEAAINAPERVRLALRAAFDEQQAAAASPPVSLSPARHWSTSISAASLSSASKRRIWGLAVAAMLLFSTITTVLWLREQRAKVGNSPPVSTAPPISQKHPDQPTKVSPKVRQGSAIHPPSLSAARPSDKRIRRRRPPVEDSPDHAAELFPLTFVAKSGPAEFVQTMRVEISRSTLLLMGLPINIERGEGPIKADLIIGEDGVARAVRLLN